MFAVSLWGIIYFSRLLHVAVTEQYVHVSLNPYSDDWETKKTRAANPYVFWINVVLAVLLLVTSVFTLYLSISSFLGS